MENIQSRFDLKTLNKVAEILKTIAHPVRISILEALEKDHQLSVTALKEHTNIEQSLLSHHLIKMKDKGILKSHREGKNIYYKLADNHILRIFECMENCSIIK
ncbi:ArsR/SmtB family transcription factor [Chondrinema litorale]|uniref:ArsR/SmtB family transcription factor n=1 Tax=Chondrinema litorale TaxID=2994555 RepID=UPI00254353F8|nr:metalloregulator ArsR/SmtB family transcription factor [Chondrinema litorale]UZR95993.1 metalloregulator ArsR/SmtB family transcription factor [Chondrinema litorale]